MSTLAAAQTCWVTENQKIAASQNARLGESVAMSGDWAIAGAPYYSQLGTTSGAAFVLHNNGSNWVVTQTLAAPPGTPTPQNDVFGTSVAMQGTRAVIGSPGEAVGAFTTGGAVHIFELVDGAWVHMHRIVASDAQADDLFGSAVAIDGDALIVGALRDDDLGSNAGSAYVFRWNGVAWVQEQKLLAWNGLAGDMFGTSVSISGGVALVGAPLHDVPSTDTGAAYLFRFDGTVWSAEQHLSAPDSTGYDEFGTTVLVRGASAFVAATEHDEPYNVCGAVYAYEDGGTNWILDQKIQPSDPFPGARFGSALAVDGNRLLVGAETRRADFPSYADKAGAGYLFEHDRSAWSQQLRFRAHHVDNTDVPSITDDNLGASAAISGDNFLLGAPMPFNASPDYGAVLFFDRHPPDCDNNRVPDVCEADCNHNLTPDTCEIADGTWSDCNDNFVPDACDDGFDYVVDDGNANGVYGSGFCPSPPRDLIWLNGFTVLPGQSILTNVGIAWTGFTPHGTPATILIYRDPDNDGHPQDAQLLAGTSAIAYDDFGLNVALTFTMYQVPPTFVGNTGDRFFVGVLMSFPCGLFAAVGSNSKNSDLGWMIAAPFGQANINNLSANTSINQHNHPWAVRAIARDDCNLNETDDLCDIYAGTSTDFDANNIPDECQSTPANDACISATIVQNGVAQVTTVHATTDGPAEPNGCDFAGDAQIFNDVWLRYPATCTGTVTISLCDANFDARLAVYIGCPSAPGQMIACSDNDCGNAPQVTFTHPSAVVYRVRIGSADGSVGGGTLIATCTQAPCPADIAPQPDGDGTVGIADILMVISFWATGAGSPADINGDDVVNIADLLACIGAWGACP